MGDFCKLTVFSDLSILALSIWISEILSVGSQESMVCKSRMVNKVYQYGNENLCPVVT